MSSFLCPFAVACTVNAEDMRLRNIRLKWENWDKIYSTDGNVVEFVCLGGYIPHPHTRSLRVYCVNGEFDYPSCIRYVYFQKNTLIHQY